MTQFIQTNLALSILVAVILGALTVQASLWLFERRASGHTTPIDPVADAEFKEHSSRGTYQLHLVTPHTPVSRENCSEWGSDDCLDCDEYKACSANARSL